MSVMMTCRKKMSQRWWSQNRREYLHHEIKLSLKKSNFLSLFNNLNQLHWCNMDLVKTLGLQWSSDTYTFSCSLQKTFRHLPQKLQLSPHWMFDLVNEFRATGGNFTLWQLWGSEYELVGNFKVHVNYMLTKDCLLQRTLRETRDC